MAAPQPLHVFQFQVDAGFNNVGFMRVQLPRIERDVVRYRDGSSRDGAVRLLPGLTRYGECTLERAVVPADNQFFQWMQAGQVGAIQRRDVQVSLLDAQFQPVAVWRLRNCFPVALDWSVLDARSSDVLIESLRLAVEGVEVESLN